MTTGGVNSQPSLSPDGRWVVYTSAREGMLTLWRIQVAGGEATKLTDGPSSWTHVSPDGQLIAYAQPSDVDPSEVPLPRPLGRAEVRLMIIPFAGGEPVKGWNVPLTASLGGGSVTWTQDGKAIMFKDLVQGQGVWRQALDEEEPQAVKALKRFASTTLRDHSTVKALAYTSGTATREIILIENFR